MAAPSTADHLQEPVVKLPPNHRSCSVHETTSSASADRHHAMSNFSSKINRSSLKILHSRYVNVQSIHSNSLRKVQEVDHGDGEGDDDDGMLNLLSSSATVLSTLKSDSRRSYSNLMVRPSSAIAEQEILTTNKHKNKKNNSMPAQAQAQDQAPPRPKGLMKRLGSFLSSRKKPAASAPAPAPAPPAPAPVPVPAMKANGNLVEDHNANSWSFKKLQAVTPLQQNDTTVKATNEECVVQKMVPKACSCEDGDGDGGGDGDGSSDLDHGNSVQAPDHAPISNPALNSSAAPTVSHPSEGGASSTVASAGLMAELTSTANPSGISSGIIRSSSGCGNLMQEFNAGSSRIGSGHHESSTSRGGGGSSSSSSSLHTRRKSLRRVWQQVGGRVFSCGSSSGHMSGILVEEMEHQRPLPSAAIADLSQLHRTITTSCRGSSSHEGMAFLATSSGDGGAIGAGPQRLDEDLVLDEAYWLSLAESIIERQQQEQARQVHNACSTSRDGDGDDHGHGDGASAVAGAGGGVVAGKNPGAHHRCGDHSNSPASSSSSSAAAIMDPSADHESTNLARSHESWSEAGRLISRPWQKSEVEPWQQEEGAAYSELKIEEEEPSSSSSSLSSSSSSKRPEMIHDCSASVLGASFDSSITNGVNFRQKKPWMAIKRMQMTRSSLKQHCSGNGKEAHWLPHHRLNTKLEESPCLLQSHHLQQRVAMAEGGGAGGVAGSSRSDNSSSSSGSSGSNSQSNTVEIRVRNQSNGGMDQCSHHQPHHHHHHHQSSNNRDGAESSGAGGVDRMSEQGRGGAETLQPLERFLMLERADCQGSMEASAQKEEEAAVAVAMAMAEPSAGGGGRTSLMALLHEEKEEEEEQHQQPAMVSDREELSLQQKLEEEEEEEDEGLEGEEDEEDEDEEDDEDEDQEEGEEQKVKTKTKKTKTKKKKKKAKKKGRAMAMANDPLQCCVCMVGRRGAALIPCGHTFCRSCSKQLFAERGACPLCNNLIVQVLHIF